MKSLNEIGLHKAIKFTVNEIFIVLMDFCILPQLRVIILRFLGAKIGKNTIINKVKFINAYHAGFKGLHIGDNCFIGDGCLFDLYHCIVIGNDVTLAQNIIINTHINVGYKDNFWQRYYPTSFSSVIIEDNSFVGTNCFIIFGTRISHHSFIGAYSNVVKSTEPYTINFGNPCKKIKSVKLQ